PHFFMGIIEQLFGSFGGKKEAKEVSLEEAQRMVEEKIALEEKELIEGASKGFAQIKHLLLSLSKRAKSLESQLHPEQGNQRFRQIVSTSQKNLTRQLEGLARKISPPSKISAQTIREYAPGALKSLTADLLPYWKNIALTKLLLKDEIKYIGQDIEELTTILQQINSTAHSQKLEGAYSLQQMFSQLSKAQEEEILQKQMEQKTRSEISQKKMELEGLEKKLSEKKASEQMQMLLSFEKKKSSLESEKQKIVISFNDAIAPLEKVLKRMQGLPGDLPQKEGEILSMLLLSPVGVFVADPNGANLKSIMQKAKKMIEDGSISLKEGEKKKRLEAIDEFLKKDFFSEYFWALNKLQVELVQIEKELSLLQISREIKLLEAQIKECRSELDAMQKKLLAIVTLGKIKDLLGKIEQEFPSAIEGYKIKS
ncbi:MAG TPA: hypothetical protein VJG83_03460, partial [archaeon]|nr:hypothetical protein [archaeon]